jgi:DNA-binding protein YbaB
MVNERIEQAMRQVAVTAERATRNPEAAVLGRFRGDSRAGTVTVWVDPVGRLDHVKIAPGSVLPGDESALATSVEEAYAAALASLAELTPDYLEPWRPEERAAPPSPESDSVMRDAF